MAGTQRSPEEYGFFLNTSLWSAFGRSRQFYPLLKPPEQGSLELIPLVAGSLIGLLVPSTASGGGLSVPGSRGLNERAVPGGGWRLFNQQFVPAPEPCQGLKQRRQKLVKLR
ncbi:hypothetical protein [Pontibacter beigongshangensis]|uniref:hypothetical protein n=1 Tax=Pontibacter beigongshangensis TaxID=2574733 RepID=UPI001650C26D|nr:hypothetical protein [Pontibacter beigongshangensis]